MSEQLAATHMRELGFFDAKVTASGADGGIDVTSRDAIAQVKCRAVPTGIAEVQRLQGTVRPPELAIFYSLAGYTESAVAAADASRIALFQFTEQNMVVPLNDTALRLDSGALSINAEAGEEPSDWAAGEVDQILPVDVDDLVEMSSSDFLASYDLLGTDVSSFWRTAQAAPRWWIDQSPDAQPGPASADERDTAANAWSELCAALRMAEEVVAALQDEADAARQAVGTIEISTLYLQALSDAELALDAAVGVWEQFSKQRGIFEDGGGGCDGVQPGGRWWPPRVHHS